MSISDGKYRFPVNSLREKNQTKPTKPTIQRIFHNGKVHRGHRKRGKMFPSQFSAGATQSVPTQRTCKQCPLLGQGQQSRCAFKFPACTAWEQPPDNGKTLWGKPWSVLAWHDSLSAISTLLNAPGAAGAAMIRLKKKKRWLWVKYL